MKFIYSEFCFKKIPALCIKTFDTLINAFRFNIQPLSGTKVNSRCRAKLANFRKTSVILSKLSDFGSIFFWLECIVRKMDNHYFLLANWQLP